jgi:hypothetical protein
MSSEKVPMAPASLEINVHAEERFTGLSMAMMITELLYAELLISSPELKGGLCCLEALSGAMPSPGKVFITECIV